MTAARPDRRPAVGRSGSLPDSAASALPARRAPKRAWSGASCRGSRRVSTHDPRPLQGGRRSAPVLETAGIGRAEAG